MNNRLFTDTATNSNLSLSEQLNLAIKNNDSAAIDQLLLKSKNRYCSLDSLLELALRRQDFTTVGKLIAAGAETISKHESWVSDNDDCYPYGSYQTIRTSVFKDTLLYPCDFKALAQGLTSMSKLLQDQQTPAPKPL